MKQIDLQSSHQLIFKPLLAKSKDGDHHQDMNSVVFLEWFENQLMAALKINLFHQ
jgi:hypothetical protein